ncbi:glutamine amidotransferase-related protein [Sneathiella sp.]|jgi:GMP synthase (glutamine-hydrolysing)|uniref:glutamine amidotransferase-related protein n=1 Tax=Sneathiella sp. TaxID=1964365 RepID=UPI0039E4F71D
MSSNKILLILHQARSDPGRVGEALRTLGYELDMRIPAIGHSLPEDVSEHKATVVFGGPMSANDDHEDYILQEARYVDRVLNAEKPYFGICLGAQIMARSLGATVDRHPDGYMEIGYHPVHPTQDEHPLFPSPMKAFQWHKEGFDLPKACELLATSPEFNNQAFQYGTNAFGIQFHPEVTEAMNRRWLDKASHMLVEPGAQSAEEQLADRAEHDDTLRLWLDNFLNQWIGPAS